MKTKYNNTPISKQRGHAKQIGMMAICCGLPILLLLGVAAYGINSQSLDFIILLICPISMGLMMWMMMRGKKAPAESVDSLVTQVKSKESKNETSSVKLN